MRKFLTKVVIHSRVFSVYIWDNIVEMNAYEESLRAKYYAFPDRYKPELDNPYGSDGFIVPAESEIHLMWGDLYNKELVLRNLAHEVAHAIFWAKDKDDYYKDERLVDACAETYEEIYNAVAYVNKVMEEKDAKLQDR